MRIYLGATLSILSTQTPWLQDIDGAGFDLNNAGMIHSSEGFKFPDGSIQTSADKGQTPWVSNIDGVDYTLTCGPIKCHSNVASVNYNWGGLIIRETALSAGRFIQI